MKNPQMDEQARLQLLAEQAEKLALPPGSDAGVESYRQVMRALRQPPAYQLPANFAAQIAARVGGSEENSRVEDWLMSLLLLGLAATGIIYAQPVLASVFAQLNLKLPEVPWPLLLAAGASIAVAWAVDRAASGWRQQRGAH